MWQNLYEVSSELVSKRDFFFAIKQMFSFKQSSTFNVKPLLKVILTCTTAAEDTYYPHPELQDALTEPELKTLNECLDLVYEHTTIDAMTARLMANLRKPKEGEENKNVYDKYLQLLDVAEKKDVGAGTVSLT